MKIKICGLTNVENLSGVINLKPEYTGFIFSKKSPRYMVDKLKPADLDIIDRKIKKTGVFVNPVFNELLEFISQYNLDCIQLHGEESPDFCHEIQQQGMEIIKAFRIDEKFPFHISDYIPVSNYFLFDTKTELPGGSGRKFKWELINNYNLGHPFFLSGGIGEGDVREILCLNHPSLAGVDLNSRFESEPGIKDIEKLKNFIQELRS